MKKLFYFVLVLFIFGCATTPVTIKQLEQKTGSKVLNEQEIKDHLVGKDLTSVFVEYGNTCQLHLSEDGRVKGSSPNSDSTGTWHIKTNEVGLPVLVMSWNSSWGTEKGTVVEKDGKINLVSQGGSAIYRDIKLASSSSPFSSPVTIQQLEQKTGSKVLTEQEIKNRLVGKDLTGIFAEHGNTCQLHLSEDGRAKGGSTNTDSTGTWYIKTNEVGLPILVMSWNSSWGTEKGTVVEKDGKINLVSQGGSTIYRDIK